MGWVGLGCRLNFYYNMMMKIMYITTTYSIAGRYHMIGLGGSAVKSENGNLLTIPGLLKKKSTRTKLGVK